MGAQIAQLFSQAGYCVKAYDVSEEQVRSGLELIRSGRYGLDSLAARGDISTEQAKGILSCIETTNSLECACEESDLILEAAIEHLETKRSIFLRASQASRDGAILASNTSTLSISKIVKLLPERVRAPGRGHAFLRSTPL